MRQLLRAQAYRTGADASKVIVNTEDKAKDDGCDGWSPKPSQDDPWLGLAETCWQFKAGKAGQPSKLGGEVTKPIPQKTLRTGGQFILVASGSVQGQKGERDRHKKLADEASASGLPITGSPPESVGEIGASHASGGLWTCGASRRPASGAGPFAGSTGSTAPTTTALHDSGA